jgi:hypothetical protein
LKEVQDLDLDRYSIVCAQYCAVTLSTSVSIQFYGRNYQHFFYEAGDQPSPLKKDFKQERLKDKAMATMVHLRNVF